MKRQASRIFTLLFMVSVFCLCLNVQLGKSTSSIITVPTDYPTIQGAIDHANAGDTIFVRNGVYDEHIEIDKSLTLQGESCKNTLLKIQSVGHYMFGLRILASFVTISGFEISPSSHSSTPDVMLVDIGAYDVYCSNVTVKNNVLINNGTTALMIQNSQEDYILDNQISCDNDGTCISGDHLNSSVVRNNTVTGGWMGIGIIYGSDNIISSNTISQTTLAHFEYYGYGGGAISLSDVSNTTITENTLVDNKRGIEFSDSLGSRVYRNNFIHNPEQVILQNVPSMASWDDGYPLGGNYWSDYTGLDSRIGIYQNETGSDGIGDTPYVIGSGNQDNYPLMGPYWNSADVNRDMRVDIKDVLAVSRALGSCPSDPKWNPLCDVNCDLVVDIKDFYIVCRNYGKTYSLNI